MIVTSHQPDLLPYTGFWHKMAKADLFDLKVWAQFVDRGYQRRVMMRERWVSLPLVKGPRDEPIHAKLLKPEAPGFLADEIAKRYNPNPAGRAVNWDKYGPMLCDEILSIRTESLMHFNIELIMLVRDILGIETPVCMGKPTPPELRGAAGVVASLQAYPAPVTYLSGPGARAYMGDCSEFTEAGMKVEWSRHEALTGDSILTTLFDCEDPMSIVKREAPA